MKIQNIEISNWRSIKEINVAALDLMVVIGQNNHGKSNFLSAILFFFGEIKHQELDFNYGSNELHVELTFGDLDEADKITFKKYLTSENRIVVRKSAFLEGSFQYRGYIENPAEEWLQEANASAYTKRELAESLPFHQFLPPTGRILKQQIIDAQDRYINQNRQDLQFSFEQETTNFLGLKTVAKGIFGDVFFIPAVKEAADDFSSKESSVFGKLYAGVVEAMSEDNIEWKDTKTKLSGLFATLNKLDDDGNVNCDRPIQLAEFEAELTQELKAWGAEVDIEVSPPDIESVFRASTQVWVNDGVRTDIRRKGHGLQRALTVALIQVIANQSRARAEADEGASTSRKVSNSRYFVFEEPELYLHPQAQRALFDSFVGLSETDNQVVLCTHSSGLIDVEKYRSIYIVTKDSEAIGSKIKKCQEDLFDGDSKKDFNLSYWINPDRGELFFANKVILLEGATDKTVIPVLAKKLEIFKYEYTLIDCGSKDNIPLYIRLLNKFSIPYVAVYDQDHQEYKSAEAIASADMSTRLIEREIDAHLGTSIVLNNDIEEELGLQDGNKHKPYEALTHVSSNAFVLSQAFKHKIQIIYDAPV